MINNWSAQYFPPTLSIYVQLKDYNVGAIRDRPHTAQLQVSIYKIL